MARQRQSLVRLRYDRQRKGVARFSLDTNRIGKALIVSRGIAKQRNGEAESSAETRSIAKALKNYHYQNALRQFQNRLNASKEELYVLFD